MVGIGQWNSTDAVIEWSRTTLQDKVSIATTVGLIIVIKLVLVTKPPDYPLDSDLKYLECRQVSCLDRIFPISISDRGYQCLSKGDAALYSGVLSSGEGQDLQRPDYTTLFNQSEALAVHNTQRGLGKLFKMVRCLFARLEQRRVVCSSTHVLI